uniref:Uncharacterized protein n=1 Tax=Staphylococcus saprophyticus TaxID=29385 RepID=A0A9P1NSK9_STASA|nr:hypothetical protein SSAP_P210 [Staphylococcus saprophyticus]
MQSSFICLGYVDAIYLKIGVIMINKVNLHHRMKIF